MRHEYKNSCYRTSKIIPMKNIFFFKSEGGGQGGGGIRGYGGGGGGIGGGECGIGGGVGEKRG